MTEPTTTDATVTPIKSARSAAKPATKAAPAAKTTTAKVTPIKSAPAKPATKSTPAKSAAKPATKSTPAKSAAKPAAKSTPAKKATAPAADKLSTEQTEMPTDPKLLKQLIKITADRRWRAGRRNDATLVAEMDARLVVLRDAYAKLTSKSDDKPAATKTTSAARSTSRRAVTARSGK